MSSAPDMRNAGNLVLEVRELRKLVKKQGERISELEQTVIRLMNIVQRDYLERIG